MPACRVMCAGECIGHAGVQMGKWSVHEVRVVQSASTVTFAGRSQQRRERVDGADARLSAPRTSRASSRCLETVASLFSAGVNSGRRPEAIAAEFGLATLL